MISKGYIKLWRKSINSRSFQNADLWKVWTWCLMKANHEKAWVPIQTGRGMTEVEVLPGQFIFGRKTAAYELKMKAASVYDRMKKLEKMKNIVIQPGTHFSRISIVNWESYQSAEDVDQQPNQQASGNQPAGIQQASGTNKNDKNDKNNNIYVGTDAPTNGCPYEKIKSMYHEILPELPRVKTMSKKRMGYLKARWTSGIKSNSGLSADTLEFWDGLFRHIRKSKFLMGQAPPQNGRPPFVADFEWIITESNFLKILEGKYHR